MLTIGNKHLRKRYVYPNNITDVYLGENHIWPYVTSIDTTAWVITLTSSSNTVSANGGTITLTSQAERQKVSTWVNYDGTSSEYYKTYTKETASTTLSTTVGTISGNKLTIPANTQTSSRNIVVTASYGGVTKSITITQGAGATPTKNVYLCSPGRSFVNEGFGSPSPHDLSAEGAVVKIYIGFSNSLQNSIYSVSDYQASIFKDTFVPNITYAGSTISPDSITEVNGKVGNYEGSWLCVEFTVPANTSSSARLVKFVAHVDPTTGYTIVKNDIESNLDQAPGEGDGSTANVYMWLQQNYKDNDGIGTATQIIPSEGGYANFVIGFADYDQYGETIHPTYDAALFKDYFECDVVSTANNVEVVSIIFNDDKTLSVQTQFAENTTSSVNNASYTFTIKDGSGYNVLNSPVKFSVTQQAGSGSGTGSGTLELRFTAHTLRDKDGNEISRNQSGSFGLFPAEGGQLDVVVFFVHYPEPYEATDVDLTPFIGHIYVGESAMYDDAEKSEFIRNVECIGVKLDPDFPETKHQLIYTFEFPENTLPMSIQWFITFDADPNINGYDIFKQPSNVMVLGQARAEENKPTPVVSDN